MIIELKIYQTRIIWFLIKKLNLLRKIKMNLKFWKEIKFLKIYNTKILNKVCDQETPKNRKRN